jgi:hypothetical protein
MAAGAARLLSSRPSGWLPGYAASGRTVARRLCEPVSRLRVPRAGWLHGTGCHPGSSPASPAEPLGCRQPCRGRCHASKPPAEQPGPGSGPGVVQARSRQHTQANRMKQAIFLAWSRWSRQIHTPFYICVNHLPFHSQGNEPCKCLDHLDHPQQMACFKPFGEWAAWTTPWTKPGPPWTSLDHPFGGWVAGRVGLRRGSLMVGRSAGCEGWTD